MKKNINEKEKYPMERPNLTGLTNLVYNHNVELFDNDEDIYDVLDYYIERNQASGAYYIVNLSNLIKKIIQWNTFLPNIKPYYAVKCNPNDVIIELLSLYECGFDCASKNEIAKVLSVGNSPENIIYANPCKEMTSISFARNKDVDMLTFDCENELDKIKPYHAHAKLFLRIKTDDSKSLCRFSQKFGTDMDDVEGLLSLIKINKLNLHGVSFHVGSGCKDPESFNKAIKDCRKIYDLAKDKYSIKLKIIDIGGGFPGIDTDELTFETIAKRINESLDEFFKEEIEKEEIEIIAEPGRFLVTSSHILVLNIIGKKETINEQGEKIFAYTLNDSVYGSFNCKFFDHAVPEIMPYNERGDKQYKSIIFGNTCDGLDIIAEECMLPDLMIGEIVFVRNFGAYTTAASSNFNGFQVAPCKYMMLKPDKDSVSD